MNLLHLFHPPVRVPQVTQQTDSHCGPAVIQVLLAHVKRWVTQDEIVTVARVRSQIMRCGMRPDQLARAVEVLAPEMQFWFKQQTSINDLVTLVRKYHWPVAVNWQGLFYDSVEEEEKHYTNADRGHYSIVIHIRPTQDKITISDPYSEFSARPRVFSLKWFEERWWDSDIVKNKKTNRKRVVKTQRLIFLIAPKGATFPIELGMQLPEKLPKFK